MLSNNFYYFGKLPIPLPENLVKIIKTGQGHKSESNNEYIPIFLEWINTLKNFQNKLSDTSQIKHNFDNRDEISKCSVVRCKSGDEDEIDFERGIC